MAVSTFMQLHAAAHPRLHRSSTCGHHRQLPTPSLRLAKAAAATFQSQAAFWATTTAEIEAHLISAFPKSPPPIVSDPMLHRIMSTPMTMAPALCVAACELVGGNKQHAMDSAAALHLMLSAANSHENPSGFASSNVEVLNGEALYPLGYQLVAESGCDPERLLRVVLEISGAVGTGGLMEGQYMEITGVGRRSDVDWVERVCEKKVGRLYGCGAACGGILGGADDEKVEELRSFGLCVGTMHGLLFYCHDGVREEEVAAAAERLRWAAVVAAVGLEEGGEKDGILRSLVDGLDKPLISLRV